MRPNQSSRRGRVAVAGVAVMVAGILGLQAAAASTGTTFVVNTAGDALDARVGNGACGTRVGTCSLRAAVQEANALPGPDVIEVPAGTYALAIPGVNQNDITTG